MKMPDIYKRYFFDKADEREQLFAEIAAQFNVAKGMYAGSFVHITPSFHIPHMVYVRGQAGRGESTFKVTD